MPPPKNKVNIATARVIPVFLALLVAYASYVITGPLAISYLLNSPSPSTPRRFASGVAIPIVYFLLLIPVGVCWLRLLIVVWRTPGYIPLGAPREGLANETAPGLEQFYNKDVFACDLRGLPIWCAHCENWKPDRTHHNQDVGRCTQKMDHFCPWVGGVVGERSYKFFVQFLFYSLLLSTYTMTCVAFFVAERAKKGIGQDVQWLIVLGISAFFCLFTLGMVVNSFWMIFRNVTTIENIDVTSRTILLAVLLPPELQGQDLHGPPPPPPPVHFGNASPSRSGDSVRPLTSELDDPAHSSYFSNLQAPRPPRRSAIPNPIWKGTITYPLHLPSDRPPLPAPPLRTFAILETLPGMNVWDMGSYQNFKQVFGPNFHDWLLPIKHSPCADHSSAISHYPLGSDFEELLIEAGLVPRPDSMPLRHEKARAGWDDRSAASGKRRRKPRLDAGWQNGERPDGWISEKEARRMRNEMRQQRYLSGGGGVATSPGDGQRHDREGTTGNEIVPFYGPR